MEREPAEMTESLEQLAALEEQEKESGSSVHGSESELYFSELFAQVLATRAVFIEDARAFLDFSTQDVHSREEGIYCNCALWWPGGVGQLSFCSRGSGGKWVGVVCGRGGGVWWEGEVWGKGRCVERGEGV